MGEIAGERGRLCLTYGFEKSGPMPAKTIKISGARQHNLKNLHVEIPREKLVVITGMSGSGKSSLAFDTLYAEGQRRYVESLSAYARQFLDQMEKPEVDFIEGLSPAIAIEQRTAGTNPRSIIATTTEIYDYLRVLFSAVGQPHDPLTGQPIFRQTAQQIVDQILEYPPETKIILLAPLVRGEVGEFRDVVEKVKREGFVRIRVDGEIIELGRPEPIRLKKDKRHTIEAVVDRLVIREGIRSRLADSVETALKWGANKLVVLRSRLRLACSEHGATEAVAATMGGDPLLDRLRQSRHQLLVRPAHAQTFLLQQPPRRLPSLPRARHPAGARSRVDGHATQAKSLAEGAIVPWRRGNETDEGLLPRIAKRAR